MNRRLAGRLFGGVALQRVVGTATTEGREHEPASTAMMSIMGS
jgi:hypothetical protein